MVESISQSFIVTSKGKQALKYYKEGQYDLADISELQFAIIGYAVHMGIFRVQDSLKQYGTLGTQAIEQSLSEGLLKPFEGEKVIANDM